MSRALHKSAPHDAANLGQLLLAFVGLFLLTTSNDVHLGVPPLTPAPLASRNVSEQLINTREPLRNTQPKRGFRLEVHSSKKPHAKKSLRSESEYLVNAITDELNDTISLPSDIDMSVEACGDSDAYYDDRNHKLVICYELIDEMESIVYWQLRGKVRVRETLETLVTAVVLHESAHALIHTLKLPITGREEDVADQFSTLVLLHQRDGARKAMEVAFFHKVMSQIYEGEPTAYWDVHSTDGQRYYDTLCMIYGQEPEANTRLVSSKALPVDRANICEQDYQRIESAWKTLLKPYSNHLPWLAEKGSTK